MKVIVELVLLFNSMIDDFIKGLIIICVVVWSFIFNVGSSVSFFQTTADSQEEEFHENFIYGRYMSKVDSFEDSINGKAIGKGATGSPFASCDSLDTKDHSDGIWNESQTTVNNKMEQITCFSIH